MAWKPGGIEGAQTAWGLVNLPGAAYAIAIMINYGPDEHGSTHPRDLVRRLPLLHADRADDTARSAGADGYIKKE